MTSRTEQLQDQARRCRELAESAVTDEGRAVLIEIAERYAAESEQVAHAHAGRELAHSNG